MSGTPTWKTLQPERHVATLTGRAEVLPKIRSAQTHVHCRYEPRYHHEMAIACANQAEDPRLKKQIDIQPTRSAIRSATEVEPKWLISQVFRGFSCCRPVAKTDAPFRCNFTDGTAKSVCHVRLNIMV